MALKKIVSSIKRKVTKYKFTSDTEFESMLTYAKNKPVARLTLNGIKGFNSSVLVEVFKGFPITIRLINIELNTQDIATLKERSASMKIQLIGCPITRTGRRVLKSHSQSSPKNTTKIEFKHLVTSRHKITPAQEDKCLVQTHTIQSVMKFSHNTIPKKIAIAII